MLWRSLRNPACHDAVAVVSACAVFGLAAAHPTSQIFIPANPAPMSLHLVDLIVIAVYFAVIAGIGYYATRGQRTSEQYFVAGRSIPMWAVAFTIMATIISTGTFVGHPGTAYQKGLILLVPHLLVPFVLLAVAKVVVPFYRRVVRMSAYEYIARTSTLDSASD
jgi:hypothetical protein